VGTLKNYGEVCFNDKAIANILSFADDSDNGNQFIVAQPANQVVFQQIATGIYYHDTTNRAVVMVNTINGNRKGFINRAVTAAKQARRALGMVSYPSENISRTW
jgi:hypothetical protein